MLVITQQHINKMLVKLTQHTVNFVKNLQVKYPHYNPTQVQVVSNNIFGYGGRCLGIFKSKVIKPVPQTLLTNQTTITYLKGSIQSYKRGLHNLVKTKPVNTPFTTSKLTYKNKNGNVLPYYNIGLLVNLGLLHPNSTPHNPKVLIPSLTPVKPVSKVTPVKPVTPVKKPI